MHNVKLKKWLVKFVGVATKKGNTYKMKWCTELKDQLKVRTKKHR